MSRSKKAPPLKSRPFRLVKYFIFTSLIVIFIGSLFLSALNIRWARQMQRKKSEEYAHLLIENLNHQIFLQFILPVTLKFKRVRLRDKEQSERMDKVVRSTLHSFKVEMVNIYDMRNIISYSFDKDLIGRMNVGGSAFENALKGEMSSKVVQSGNFWEILLGVPKESRLVTFAPLRVERPLTALSGPVIGVVEIIQDMTADDKAIFNYQVAIVLSSALVMSFLAFILLMVVSRGEKIIQARARERFKLKEQLNRARHLSELGEMTAVISHEIRNPLGIIRSSADLLKKKMAALDPTNTIPGIIVEEVGRLNNIITDFLKFARPKTPDFNPCRVERILEKNLSALSRQLEQSGHRCELSLEGDPPEIIADQDLLYQAFLNILINAIQAMPQGGTVRIRVASGDDHVAVVFEDEGSGILEENLEKVWDPFFTTKDKGTGLGLGIVRKIIDAHGGRLSLANQKPGGIRLSVELPLTQKG